MFAVQREELVAASRRTHADFHRTVIGPRGHCWSERLLYDVQTT
jgi:hypothetical protein